MTHSPRWPARSWIGDTGQHSLLKAIRLFTVVLLTTAVPAVAVTDPGPDGVLGTADDGGTMTVYSRNCSAGDTLYQLTNPSHYGFDAYDQYRGLSLVLHKRWSDNWQVLASRDIGKAESSTAATTSASTSSAFDDPNVDINREGLTPWDRTHLVKIAANYLIAEPIGMNLGAFLRVNSGQVLVRTAQVCGGICNQGAFTVRAAAAGEDTNPAATGKRYPTVKILDLRAEKQFTMPGRWGVLHAYFDVFNVFNSNDAWGQRNFSASNYADVTAIVPPRVSRLGASWDF